MPCNSDHMNPSYLEINASIILCLLDELAGAEIIKPSWREGYHPDAYSKQPDPDALAQQLCDRLKTVDVSKQSLEMQIWWRDHQKADEQRAIAEAVKAGQDAVRDRALEKLTPEEIVALGLEGYRGV